MSDQDCRNLRKKPGYMKWYPEKWLGGSTREEMTHSERAIYADLLCKAYSNDPLGQVNFTSIRRLANELHASQKLAWGTIQKGVKYNKLRVIRVWQDPISLKKYEESELTIEQLRSDQETFSSKRSKSGVRLYAIIIIGWDTLQTAFLRQTPYPKKSSKVPKSTAELAPNSEHNEPLGEEGEEIRSKKGEDSSVSPPEPIIAVPSPPLHSSSSHESLKEQFLLLLKNCPGYAVDQEQDSLLFDYAIKEFPGIDILEQTKKKIVWWKSHPTAIHKSPRDRLREWFKKEQEFQSEHPAWGRKGDRMDPYVGSQPEGPSDEEQELITEWAKEYELKLDQYMKEHGIENEDEVDFFKLKIPTGTEYISQQLKKYRAK